MKYLKQKYWHEFRHCSRRHSTKINQNIVIKNKKIQIENVVMKMKSKLNQNIGMSVSIAVVGIQQSGKVQDYWHKYRLCELEVNHE